jgi:hypothetical protein
LYLVSFDECRTNEGDDEYDEYDEDEDDGGHSRIDRNDPYWNEVYELDLFDRIMILLGHPMSGKGLKKMWIVKRVVRSVRRMVRTLKRVMQMLMNLMRHDMMMVKRMEGLVVLLGQGSDVVIRRLGLNLDHGMHVSLVIMSFSCLA